jgi:hypothetical protein
VKLLRLSLVCSALVSLPGCIGYTKFRATNPRGEMIAEWTAEGFYYPVSGGYRITAVDRISGPPHMLESHYPHGMRTMVTGAHIERWHTNKPLWIYELERPHFPTANRSERQVREYPLVD